MSLPGGLRALEQPAFRRYWLGQIVSQLGTWMQSIALAWLVLELTGSPLRLGLVSALQFGPVLVLGLLAGVVVDTFPKRRLVIGTQAALMLAALTLAALTFSGHVRYWQVAAIAGFIGVVNALDMPARQTFVAELVGREHLINAIALNSAVFNGARIVGPSVAGLLIGRYGLAPAFLLNGLSFLAILGALLTLRVPFPAPARPGAAWREGLLGGIRYALGAPRVALVLGLLMVVSMTTLNHQVQVPLFGREVLRLDVAGVGFLMASLGVGATAGAVGLALLGRGRPPVGLLLAMAATITTGLLALSTVRQFGLAAALLFVIGGAQILFLTGCNTTVQLTAPPELRGRVMSLYSLLFSGMSPFGAFLVGGVAEAVSVPTAFATAGGLGLLLVAALAAWLLPRVRRAP